jgi:hypothetical protein
MRHIRFVDVPANVTERLLRLIRSSFWSEQYEAVHKVCRHALRLGAPEDLRPLLHGYRLAALHGLGEKEEAYAELEGLEPPDPNREASALYWYLHFHRAADAGEAVAAQEAAAWIVAFRGKDFEWLPAGLFLSARAYLMGGRLDAVEHTLADLRDVFEGTSWASRAETEILPAFEREQEARKKAEAAPPAEPEPEPDDADPSTEAGESFLP